MLSATRTLSAKDGLATNPRARFDYDIIETLEVGVVLLGHEVKSARSGHLSLKGSYAAIRGGECWILGMHISPYSKAGPLPGYDPTRSRKLLLSKSELKRVIGQLTALRLTLVPLRVYSKGRHLKIELGLARGKKKHEKRETIKKREQEREMRQALKRS
ncbi:MAG: SsrA-binding protein SmpB [Patescibacteria group bacterium]